MAGLRERIEEMQPLTMGQMLALAREYDAPVTEVLLQECEVQQGLGRAAVLEAVMAQYEHNLRALQLGLNGGESTLLGTLATQLAAIEGSKCFEDAFLDDVLLYTQAAQVGNHCIGLRPCAGTGDACPYAGFVMAMQKHDYPAERVAEVAALFLKIGGLFRVAKVTTGCNMEGFGAGAACIAAGTVALAGGTPDAMERAMVMALSPTIGVPCTPRVLVPALCTTHIGGAVLIGMYAARLNLRVEMDVNVPIDVMFAMAAEVHVEAGRSLVPIVVEFMEPFFRQKPQVEALIDPEVKEAERAAIAAVLERAEAVAAGFARQAAPITGTLGDAVVGGSSQAVGSPTNAARIAHGLAVGRIRSITVELYPELFARRGINIPGILMGAAFGAATGDYEMYGRAVQLVAEQGIEVRILKAEEAYIQKITIETDEMCCWVDTLNRGGGRVHLRDASPSLARAREVAEELGIVLA